jgi:hypothetical protein
MERERRVSTKTKTAESRARRMAPRKKTPAARTILSSDPAAPFWQPFDHPDVRALLVMFGDDLLETVSAPQAATLLAQADSHFVSRPYTFPNCLLLSPFVSQANYRDHHDNIPSEVEHFLATCASLCRLLYINHTDDVGQSDQFINILAAAPRKARRQELVRASFAHFPTL